MADLVSCIFIECASGASNALVSYLDGGRGRGRAGDSGPGLLVSLDGRLGVNCRKPNGRR